MILMASYWSLCNRNNVNGIQQISVECLIILLNNNGTIVCKHRIEEQYWTYYENNLSFYDNSGKTMFEFTNFNLDKKNESSSSFGKSYLQMIGFWPLAPLAPLEPLAPFNFSMWPFRTLSLKKHCSQNRIFFQSRSCSACNKVEFTSSSDFCCC